MQHQVDILFVINDLKFLKSHRIDLIKFLVSKGLKVSVATNLEGAKLGEVEKIQKNIQNLLLSILLPDPIFHFQQIDLR